MAAERKSMTRLVSEIVPSLSRSLAEQFNVFQVMRHGTHEKQLSNVFAWLLEVNGNHELGDAFQTIFIECLNEKLPIAERLPPSLYRVTQEVDTSGEAEGKDIADIVLTSRTLSVVIENFGTSDGHGHDYFGYLSHGESGGRRSVVVLLCIRHEPHLQRDGWENAPVLTYAELLTQLQIHIDKNGAWREHHPQQLFFLEQLIGNFLEGPWAVSNEERIAFIATMCETGESARYGFQKHDVAAREFAALVAQHAQRQFDDGRVVLGEIKRKLTEYAKHTLFTQLNQQLTGIVFNGVTSRFMGQYSWLIALTASGGPAPKISLMFGPTAVNYIDRLPEPQALPDFSRLFVRRKSDGPACAEAITQTDIGLEEILSGLKSDDLRLCKAVIELIGDWAREAR